MSGREYVHVLLIEDDPGDAELIKQALRLANASFQVQWSVTMSAALEQLATQKFDVVLLDLKLPDTSGQSVISTIRQQAASVPIVVLTGLDDPHLSLDSLQDGAQDIMTKEVISPRSLGRLIRYAIQRQQLHDALEETRRLSEQKTFQQILESFPDAMVIVDQGDTIVFVNYQTEQLFGYKRDEVLGKPYDLLSPRLLREGCAVWGNSEEQFGRRKNGTSFPMEVRLATIDTDKGKLISAAICDITKRKKAEEELKEKDKQLYHSQKLEAIGSLASSVAHEFNNLLQVIQGYTNFAIQEFDEEDQRLQDLKQVLTASDRAATLTRLLLGLGRRQAIEPIDLDPNNIVRDLVKLIRPLIGEHIELHTVLGDELGAIHVDPTLIQQVLMNLCINARDAMPDGGSIVMKTESVTLSEAYCRDRVDTIPGNYIMFSITDSGIGMTSELIDRIFEPYFTTKNVGKGTGLGLAMVYGAVRQHKGSIEVCSEPHVETTFRIYIPLADHNAKETSIRRDEAPALGGRETILLAEDEPLVRSLGIRLLTEAGYQILAASDGQEAVQIYRENCEEISLAILDVVMPKMSGHSVYRAITMLKPDAKVLFCTGYDAEKEYGRFADNEELQLVQKPFDRIELLSAVRNVLDGEASYHSLQALT